MRSTHENENWEHETPRTHIKSKNTHFAWHEFRAKNQLKNKKLPIIICDCSSLFALARFLPCQSNFQWLLNFNQLLPIRGLAFFLLVHIIFYINSIYNHVISKFIVIDGTTHRSWILRCKSIFMHINYNNSHVLWTNGSAMFIYFDVNF